MRKVECQPDTVQYFKCNTNELRPFEIMQNAWKLSAASRVTESP